MMPQHVAIILDGNRRFAKRLMKKPWEGHNWGAKKVRELMKWCSEKKLHYITLYSFSIQNMERPKKEFEFLMKLFEREFKEIAKPDHEVHEYGIKVNVIGRINLLPKNVRDAIKSAENATKNYNNYFLNLALAYGGQEEITDAVRKIAKDVAANKIKTKQINENLIRKNLYAGDIPYPDMIIRTGGEKRLSNFLLWQCAYSELFFIDKMWPEITKKDFFKALKDFEKRKRRFGR